MERLRRAWRLFDVACDVKGEVRKLDSHLRNMTRGADEGLEYIDCLENALSGDLDMSDVTFLGFKALNGAPQIDPTLQRKRPWRWWHEG